MRALKKIIAFITTIVAGLIFVSWASATTLSCIQLTTPLTRPYYATHACLTNVDWQPGAQQFATRLSYGYVDGASWRETGDLHGRVVNIPAVADNPNTPENEAVPANPAYDNAMAIVNSANLQVTPLENVILGLIQAGGGPVGSIVEVTP